MHFDVIATYLLLGLSQFLGISNLPSDLSPNWAVVRNWEPGDKVSTFSAESTEIINQCKTSGKRYVQFPIVVLASQEVFLDGTLATAFGDSNLHSMRSFYGAPIVSCPAIEAAHKVTWNVYSSSKYFSRIAKTPWLTNSNIQNIFSESLNFVAVGSLWAMAIVSLVIFLGKVPHSLTLSLVFSNLVLSLYFLFADAGYAGLSIPTFYAHKAADIALWVGLALFFNALYLSGVLGKKLYITFLINIAIACPIIALGNTLDFAQFGTSLPFGLGLWVDFYCGFNLIRKSMKVGFKKDSIFTCLSLAFFIIVCTNDVLVVTGVIYGYMILSVGCAFGLLFFLFSVNEQITMAYEERDYLRKNLESEVERKTLELRTKSEDLEVVVSKLKVTQAELIQSAKLASLGTLSAGIAHEINNSLNYVYGSLRPIEKMVGELPDDPRKAKLLTLTKIMQEGMKLTFEIIKSLKNFTGLNQAKVNDFALKDVVDSVLTILRSKLKDHFVVEAEVDPEIRIFGSMVGMNQVLMNLLSNAIDAMPEGGKLKIRAESMGTDALIYVSDTGTGIPENIRTKLFDPFFTTKEVGSGTGLGLYIVKKEIDRHHGTIEVTSEVGKGTTFTIRLPLRGMETMGVAA